jgi:hypothetical protein
LNEVEVEVEVEEVRIARRGKRRKKSRTLLRRARDWSMALVEMTDTSGGGKYGRPMDGRRIDKSNWKIMGSETAFLKTNAQERDSSLPLSGKKKRPVAGDDYVIHPSIHRHRPSPEVADGPVLHDPDRRRWRMKSIEQSNNGLLNGDSPPSHILNRSDLMPDRGLYVSVDPGRSTMIFSMLVSPRVALLSNRLVVLPTGALSGLPQLVTNITTSRSRTGEAIHVHPPAS